MTHFLLSLHLLVYITVGTEPASLNLPDLGFSGKPGAFGLYSTVMTEPASLDLPDLGFSGKPGAFGIVHSWD